RAHLGLEIAGRRSVPWNVRKAWSQEDLHRLLQIDRVVAPEIGPPGVAVRAVEAHVEGRLVPGEPDRGLLEGGASTVRTLEGRQGGGPGGGGGGAILRGERGRGGAPAKKGGRRIERTARSSGPPRGGRRRRATAPGGRRPSRAPGQPRSPALRGRRS